MIAEAIEHLPKLSRADVDAAVLRSVSARGDARGAVEISQLAAVSLMAAAYALRRLEDAGLVERYVTLIDTPARSGCTVVVWRRAGAVLQAAWPSWLSPTTVPPAGGRTRVRQA